MTHKPSSTTGHTPGPWAVDVIYLGKDRQHTDFAIRAASHNMPDGSRVALVSDGSHVLDKTPNREALANARLIASAPALLEALKEAHFFIERTPSSPYDLENERVNRAIRSIEAAIAQAIGGDK